MCDPQRCPAGPARTEAGARLARLVKRGLIRELHQRHYITAKQFEELMRLHREP